MKVLSVGDIHTKTWIFDLVEQVIDNYDAVVFVGDYADDFGAPALRSIQTWKRLHDMWTKYQKIYPVQGNHDYVYCSHIHPQQSGYNHTTQMLIDAPENAGLKSWVSQLPFVLEIDGVSYAHAGIDKRWNGENDDLSMWADTSPIWARPEWAEYKNIKQVVGHTPQKTVTEVEPGIWVIDTFSTYPNGDQYGDGTMLEVLDGKQFKKIKINDNSNPTSFKGGLS